MIHILRKMWLKPVLCPQLDEIGVIWKVPPFSCVKHHVYKARRIATKIEDEDEEEDDTSEEQVVEIILIHVHTFYWFCNNFRFPFSRQVFICFWGILSFIYDFHWTLPKLDCWEFSLHYLNMFFCSWLWYLYTTKTFQTIHILKKT